MTRLALLSALVFVLTGCDRPVVGPVAASVEVVGPDLSAVLLTPEVRLQISVDALRGVDEVRVNGSPATRDDASGLWEIDLTLASGANRFLLEALSDGTASSDTAYAVYLPIQRAALGNVLPEARAGHTMTVRESGFILAGGIGQNGDVLGSLRTGSEIGQSIVFGAASDMQIPRAGHTATTLPDGRVLFLGGVSTAAPPSASAFARTPEVYVPLTGTTRPVIVRGVPLLRAGHTAVLLERQGRLYIYAFGGRVPGVGTTPSISGTFDIFEFRSGPTADTLVTFTPLGGAGGPLPLADPTQVVLRSTPLTSTSVLLGLEPASTGSRPLSRQVLYTAPGAFYPFDVADSGRPFPGTPRTAADGAGIRPGLAFIAGGVDAVDSPLATAEVYTDLASRFFSSPVGLAAPRYDHTVTLLPSGRILALGGRDAGGRPLQTAEVLSF